MSIYELRAVKPDGTDEGILPQHAGIEASLELSDVGSIRLLYPQNGLNFGLLTDQREVRLLIDGVEPANARWILEEDEGNDVTEDQTGALETWVGRSLFKVLEGGLVWPTDNNVWDDAKPGKIMRNYMLRAQTRGAVTGITYASFSDTLDSNGVAWTKQLDIEYTPGVTLLQIVQNLVEQGACDAAMVGRDLRLYNPGTLSTDRTVQANPVILRKGRDIAEAPRRRSTRDLSTVALVIGDNAAYQIVTDATALAVWGRRERFISQGGVSDPGTLAVIGQVQLDLVKQARLEKTHGLTLDPAGPQPLVDYFVGDYVFSDVGNGNERYRIRQYVLTIGQDGTVGGSIVLNDKFAEAEEALNRRVNGILGGASVTGVSPAKPVDPSPRDTLAPAQVASPIVSSAPYTSPTTGLPEAQLTISWAAVTTNADASPITDLAGYEVQWRYSTETNFTGAVFTPNTAAYVSPVRLGVNVVARVRAVDTNNNRGAWSAETTQATATDTAAPPTPSTPVVENRLGALRITWDGLGSAGEAMPADFDRIEVHVSTVNNFTPSSATLKDSYATRGGVTTQMLTYDQLYYVKFVAYDVSGNPSPASAQGSGTPQRGVDADFASVSASKIVAGTLSADITVSARIKTADTGARVELSGAGIGAWNSSGQKTFEVLAGNGSVTIVGLLSTAFSGPRVTIGQSGTTREVSFYGTDLMAMPPKVTTADYIGDSYLSLSGGRKSASDGAGNRVEIFPRDASNEVGIQIIAEGGNILLYSASAMNNFAGDNVSGVLWQLYSRKMIHSGSITANTDSNGFITWSHGSGFTPDTMSIEVRSPLSGSSILPFQHGTDQIGATTARTRFLTQAGAVYASASVTFNFVAMRDGATF